jgi:hypothetical protein
MRRPSWKVDLNSEPSSILVFDLFYRKGCQIIIGKDLYLRPVLGQEAHTYDGNSKASYWRMVK